MSTTVDLAFVKQYEREVHEAYQRMGSKLRNTVRNKNNVKGSSTTFQKVGKGAASTKTRHGKVPVMNVDQATGESGGTEVPSGCAWPASIRRLKLGMSPCSMRWRAMV